MQLPTHGKVLADRNEPNWRAGVFRQKCWKPRRVILVLKQGRFDAEPPRQRAQDPLAVGGSTESRTDETPASQRSRSGAVRSFIAQRPLHRWVRPQITQQPPEEFPALPSP